MTIEGSSSQGREVTESELRSTFAEYVSLDEWPPELGAPVRKVVDSAMLFPGDAQYFEYAMDEAAQRFVGLMGMTLPEDPTERTARLAQIRYPRPEAGDTETNPGQWRAVVVFPRTRVVLFASAHDAAEFAELRSRLVVKPSTPPGEE